jgi:hypothetical protein
VRHKVSSASLRGAPVNWTSWPAPSTSILDAPIRSARSSQMASKPALWPPETTSFGKEAAARSARARSVYQQLAAWRPTGLHATRPRSRGPGSRVARDQCRLLVRLVAQPAPRHRHARVCDGPLGRIPATRGPARPLTHHHRRPVRHRRGGAGRDRRGLGARSML